jgi:hypothetical protein
MELLALKRQVRMLALQLRELSTHVATLARLSRVSVDTEFDAEARSILSNQLENELLELTASIDRLLDALPPELRGEGNGA